MKRFSRKPRRTTTHNYAHTTPSKMSSDATHHADTLANCHNVTDLHQSAADEAFPGLPNHLVVTHILSQI